MDCNETTALSETA
jgi:hypothetical protein